jgi:hypothetical protein
MNRATCGHPICIRFWIFVCREHITHIKDKLSLLRPLIYPRDHYNAFTLVGK